MPSYSALPTPTQPKPVVVGLSGASGSWLGLRLVQHLLVLKQPVELVLSEKSIQVLQQETHFKPGPPNERVARLLDFLELPPEKADLLHWYGNHEIGAPAASGTHLTQGMVVAPCSMSTLAKIALGLSDNLLTRAADVCLKEQRPLMLLPRETPLNAIHLEHMHKLALMGVRIIPPMLAFYNDDFLSMEGQLDYTLGKVLDHLGLDHNLYTRWSGMEPTVQGS
jgi:4-hydroxy-3-polyprenylbenzoate decarboxylase